MCDVSVQRVKVCLEEELGVEPQEIIPDNAQNLLRLSLDVNAVRKRLEQSDQIEQSVANGLHSLAMEQE